MLREEGEGEGSIYNIYVSLLFFPDPVRMPPVITTTTALPAKASTVPHITATPVSG